MNYNKKILFVAGVALVTCIAPTAVLADIDRSRIDPFDMLIEPLPPAPPTPYQQCILDSTEWFNRCLDLAERDGIITDEETIFCADTVDEWQEWCDEQFGPPKPPREEKSVLEPIPVPVPDPVPDGECEPESGECEPDEGLQPQPM